MMRASLPVVLTLPFALTGCPALLSDWTTSGTGAADASVDAAGLEAGGASPGSGGGDSGASSGSSGGSSDGAAGAPSGGSSSGGSGGSSSAGSGGSGGSMSSGGGSSATGRSSSGCLHGADCSGSTPVCLNGSCAACSLGTTQCAGGTQPQTCSESGTWQNSGSPVIHDNGIGQTWQDCVPLDTYNQTQAMKACAASGAGMCLAMGRVCTVFEYEQVRGYTAGGALIGFWGFEGNAAGYAAPVGYGICNGSDWRWH